MGLMGLFSSLIDEVVAAVVVGLKNDIIVFDCVLVAVDAVVGGSKNEFIVGKLIQQCDIVLVKFFMDLIAVMFKPCVSSRNVWSGAPNAPAHHANQHPSAAVVFFTHQRSSRITL